MLIYKIMRLPEWAAFEDQGVFAGSVDDQRDGFIHFSTLEQMKGTLAKHYKDEPSVVIASIETESVHANLKWEVSRGGAKFPHLYASLNMSEVVDYWTLTQSDGRFDLAARGREA